MNERHLHRRNVLHPHVANPVMCNSSVSIQRLAYTQICALYANIFASMFIEYSCTHSYICLLYTNLPNMSSVCHCIPMYSLLHRINV